ncbi:ABC transporter permease [Fructilactobacillus fructivorans]|uniref:ABC transporter permease subunit n=1 Tax=Fructilactobacillus fructivorans TaxID=1614 RepID=A0A0C1LZK9_9LACO|nr:ABC transporter permease [Fructilactobacillus fructivorans]KID42310.1 Oligopeptide transport system permease protein OppC [Fructilactobacillus fructivorans]KRK58197.1 oligopeptide ABC transporter, membrane-spanning subunit [Fructilactobacillus fructivorans]KRN12968.1 oligopeptide ABC transporter, membrane-spanning subunit [Fructilactobacillus fructivorans]KRN40928.1 oligopeptide ABC transporter, membrane-spanning subunit [Fructilactobacillus fructivorans]KRN42603.1 oligopeptide ABC transpor
MAENLPPLEDQFQFASDDLSNLDTESESINTPSLTYFQDVKRRLIRNKVAMTSLILLVIIALVAIFAPILSPHDPNAQNVLYANLPPKWGSLNIPGLNGIHEAGGHMVNAYQAEHVPKGTYYIMGTDYLGRDLFSRILYGTRLSLFIAVVATAVDLLVGVPYGLISGWVGGAVDTFMQRIVEILSSIPNLIVVVLLLLILKPGITSIIIAIAFTGWITMSRLVRAQTFKLKESEYVLAARTLGESPFKIAMKHLIPNLSSTIIIQTMFTIPSAIFFEAFLSFIGIGIPAPNASLGTLLNDGQKAFHFLPYQMWVPAIVLSVIMITTNLLGDGLRDAFDPKSK